MSDGLEASRRRARRNVVPETKDKRLEDIEALFKSRAASSAPARPH